MNNEEIVKILIVDDKPENLLALETILDVAGWGLVRAGSGKDALRQVLKEEFAVILLDVQMPKMDGFDTATLIRQRDKSAYTPIIFVTAVSKTDEAAKRGYSLGAGDYVLKPIVPEILKAKVTVFANLFRFRRQIEQQAERLRVANDEIRTLNSHLEQQSNELAAINKELETFSYSVSHDLRAPLRGILGFIQIVLRDYSGRLDETGRSHLRRIRETVGRMDAMIVALLGLSRITQQEIVSSAVDLSELARRIGIETAASEPKRNVVVTVQPGVLASGDPTLLRVVLENLIGNAWKFTGKREQARIEFGVTVDGGERAYFVRDNGAGFEMAHSERMFDAFQRLHGQEEFPGMGIGLPTVRRIINRHGGRIWAAGEVNHGATFYFTLGEKPFQQET